MAASIILIATFILISYVIYTKIKQNESTREQYAFRCLGAIISLCSLAIASIASKQGISDQIMMLISATLGHPIKEGPPATWQEKALISLTTIITIHFIYKSYENWKGIISADEAEKKRMKRSTTLIPQAIDEGVRIIKSRPRRELANQEQRIDPVIVPSEPNLVWYDHARELFELWYPSSSFMDPDLPGWTSHEKCWIGRDKIHKKEFFLFCISNEPTDDDLISFSQFATSISTKNDNLIYVVHRECTASYAKKPLPFSDDFVHILSEEYLYKNIVDFSDYFNDINKRAEKDFFPGTATSIKDLYVPSSVSSDAYAKKIISSDLSEYLSIWSEQPAGQHIALLGEYGQGKSTGALMYVYSSINSGLSSSGNRVPILLELRGKSPANLLPQELLAAWGQQYKLQAAALMKLLIAGRLILIFEGFDEMANVSSLEARISHFRSLWRFAFPKSKMLFTGRRNLFFEDRELQIAFKGASLESSVPLCEVLHLCPFDIQKIKSSLRWVDATTRSEIIAAAKRSEQIFDIVARPSLLYIVATLWGELRGLLVNGSITSAQVIDRFILHSYERQEAKEKDLGFMTLTTTERRYFHEGIAVYMANKGETNQIISSDFRAAIERLYTAYPDDAHIEDSIIIETERPPLKQRNIDHEEAIEQILTDVRTHGILVNDLGRRGAFRFAHKSFYELLAAKVHATEFTTTESIFYRSIRSAMDGSIDYSEQSPEMLNFFSEILVDHLRSTRGKDGITFSAFDLLMGIRTVKTPLKQIIRTTQIFVLRLAHSRSLKWSFYGSAILCGAVSSVITIISGLSTTALGTLLLERFPSLSYIVIHSSGQSRQVQNLGTAFIVIPIIVYLIAGGYSIWFYRTLMKRVLLWMAVLYFTDQSLKTDLGENELIHIMGIGATRELNRGMVRKYGIQFSLTTANQSPQ